jgi:hypothetical protein
MGGLGGGRQKICSSPGGHGERGYCVWIFGPRGWTPYKNCCTKGYKCSGKPKERGDFVGQKLLKTCRKPTEGGEQSAAEAAAKPPARAKRAPAARPKKRSARGG